MTETTTPTAVSGAPATAEGVDATGTATNTDASTPAAKLFKVPVGKGNNGEPVFKEFTEEDLIKHAGLGLTAHEKFEGAKKLRADMEALARAMKDPEKIWEVMKGLGHDTDSLLRKRVEQAIAEAQEDPKDRELRVTKAELERFLKAEAVAKKQKEEQELRSQTEAFTKQISDKISEALKTAKLPDTKSNRASVAQILEMLWNSKDESGNMPFPDPLKIPNDKVVSFLRKNRVDGLKSLIDGADDDALLELLPEDLVKQITKAVSKKLQKSQGVVDNTIQAPTRESKPDEKKQPQSTADFWKEQEERTRKAQVAWERRQGKR